MGMWISVHFPAAPGPAEPRGAPAAPAEPRSGRRSQSWGMPGTGPGQTVMTGTESGSGLCRGCAGAWLHQRLRERLFLGILHVPRLGKGMGSDARCSRIVPSSQGPLSPSLALAALAGTGV